LFALPRHAAAKAGGLGNRIWNLRQPLSADCDDSESPRRQDAKAFVGWSEAHGAGSGLCSLLSWGLGGSIDPSHSDLDSARSAAFPKAIALSARDGLDQRFRAGNDAKPSDAEKRVLVFVASFYPANPA
jgi:hypothetical protein